MLRHFFKHILRLNQSRHNSYITPKHQARQKLASSKKSKMVNFVI